MDFKNLAKAPIDLLPSFPRPKGEAISPTKAHDGINRKERKVKARKDRREYSKRPVISFQFGIWNLEFDL